MATSNVDWNESQEEIARNHNIKILDQDDIAYYKDLINRIGFAARYQFMNDMFAGERLPTKPHQVVAVEGRHETSEGKQTNFYQFMIDAENLAKISFVLHKRKSEYNEDGERLTTYQSV